MTAERSIALRSLLVPRSSTAKFTLRRPKSNVSSGVAARIELGRIGSVAELGAEISDDYEGREPLLVAPLKSSTVFLALNSWVHFSVPAVEV